MFWLWLLSKIPTRWRLGKLLKLFTAAHFDVNIPIYQVILGLPKSFSGAEKCFYTKGSKWFFKRAWSFLSLSSRLPVLILSVAKSITEISSIIAIILRSVFLVFCVTLISPYYKHLRCSSCRNSLRGIHHTVQSNILLKGGATSNFDGIFTLWCCKESGRRSSW